MFPAVEAAPEVSQVAPGEEDGPASRWSYGFDMGVGVDVQPQATFGVDVGFRRPNIFGRVRSEGVLDLTRLQGSICPLLGYSFCPLWEDQTLARGSAVVGVPVSLGRGADLDLAAGPAWQFRTFGAWDQLDEPIVRWAPLHPGLVLEVALRVPVTERSFVRLAVDTYAFLSVPRDVSQVPGLKPLDPGPTWNVPGSSPVVIRLGFAR